MRKIAGARSSDRYLRALVLAVLQARVRPHGAKAKNNETGVIFIFALGTHRDPSVGVVLYGVDRLAYK